jgi:hypothetical protein
MVLRLRFDNPISPPVETAVGMILDLLTSALSLSAG